jgi:F-type H+-transporting ATPase subunit gamma
MTDTLEALGRRIETTRDLQQIVRTMKSLSAVSIRQYERAVEALHGYTRTIEMGLQIVLWRLGAPDLEPDVAERVSVAVVLGSDHGLCGRFNEEIVHFAAAQMGRSPSRDESLVLAVGVQAANRLEAVGHAPDARFLLPGAVGGLAATAQSVLLAIDQWRAQRGAARITLFHNVRTADAFAEPVAQQVLPLDMNWLEGLRTRPWPSRTLPTFTMDDRALFAWLVREHLFVSLYRAGAESMASEHASRLASMQAAEHSIQEHLEEMNGAYRQRRQQDITEELLDVVAGFEAMRQA